MPRGTITAFEPARGSGHIRLETGDDVHFDVSVASTAELVVGQAVEVVTGLMLNGQLKARLVLAELPEADARPFAEGFAELKALGLFTGLGPDEAQQLAAGATSFTREAAGAVCLGWYGAKGLSARARSDGLAVLDEHFGDSAKIPVGELASLAPEALQSRLAEATVNLHPFSLGSVLAAFNGVLQQAQTGTHYFLIDVDSDRYVVVALREDAFGKAAHATVLRIVT